ncbi:MAG: hypothetical protein BMS9Abin13_525 [Patescibacteria group bacterium]|nr:MAG: hypothetical protein BMS9Abin13_525 [Patescibacteria group bacterium]
MPRINMRKDNKTIHIFAVAVPIIVLLLPLVAFSQGLVPCGSQGQSECGFADLIVLIQSVIDFLMFKVAMPLAAVAFAWAGVRMLIAGGNEQTISDAKGMLWSVLIGILIALSAWLVVKAITSVLLRPEYSLLSFL